MLLHDLSYLLMHLEQSLLLYKNKLNQSMFLRQTCTANAYKAELVMYRDVIKSL